jgi:hypothetical protein
MTEAKSSKIAGPASSIPAISGDDIVCCIV